VKLRSLQSFLIAILLITTSLTVIDGITNASSNLVFACSCELQSPEIYFANAGLVVSGEVTEITEDLDENGYRVTLNVSKVWKVGDNSSIQQGQQLSLWTSTSSGVCGFPFEADTEYIVYSSSQTQKQPADLIDVYACSGTKPVEYAAIDLLYLTTNISFGHLGERTFVISTNDGKSHSLTHSIIGGNINSITVDEETKSLIILVNPVLIPDNIDSELREKLDSIQRTLVLKLPRDIMDAKVQHPDLGQIDTDFGVMTFEKGGLMSYSFYASNPVGTPEERWITMPFNETTDMIRVTGTSVIPEFGSLIPFGLIAGVLSILVAFSRILKLGRA
jgi:hypothetical protein